MKEITGRKYLEKDFDITKYIGSLVASSNNNRDNNNRNNNNNAKGVTLADLPILKRRSIFD